MNLIDAHIHIDFYDNFSIIMRQLNRLHIESIFVTHLPELYEKYYNEIRDYGNIKLALGFHPILINEYSFDAVKYDKYLETTSFIGEVGLDYSNITSERTKEKQRLVFEHICDKGKNHVMSIHVRNAEKDVLKILNFHNVKKAIFHWYTGSLETLDEIIKCGYFFSINAMMLRSNRGKSILKKIPLNRVLIESDGPFTRYNNKIIHPENTDSVYKEFSAFYGIDMEENVEHNFASLLEFTKV